MNLRKLVPRSKFEYAKKLRKNMTLAERKVWEMVKFKRILGFRFKRQTVIRGYIVDFYCGKLKIVIEIDGSSHEGRQDYDSRRQKVLENLGMRVLRFTNDMVFTMPETVRMIIKATVFSLT